DFPLETFVIGGDALGLETVKQLFALIPGPRLKIVNVYGPTECCDVSSSYTLTRQSVNGLRRIPIGQPLRNVKCYILGPAGELQAISVAGELCIAGDGVARGYLNKPELTFEKFEVKMHFGNAAGPQIESEQSEPYDGVKPHHNFALRTSHFALYHTGDLARWLSDGNIEFLGRIDQQVKIRGFRIELGEIESQLSAYHKIKEVVVAALDDPGGGKYLCAYFVAVNACTVTELRDYLSQHLPGYMLPAYFIPLEAIPLTPNGKVDRKNLPHPKDIDIAAGIVYDAPRNPVERKLAGIWETVLGREQVGLKDNFFEIGGDSIKVIQIVSRMRKAGYKIEARDVLRNPQISELAPLVKQSERIADQSVVTGPVPLTPIQHRFVENRSVHRHHFNQAVMLCSEEGFHPEAVEAVFAKLQNHHDALRMTYREEEGTLIQTNHDLEYPLSLEVHDLREAEDARREMEVLCNKIQSSIDLSKGPLMKLGLFHSDDGGRLLIAIHHLVVDGVSWRILFEDIETLFAQYKKEETLSLPLKSDSFKVWARELNRYSAGEPFLKEIDYWKEREGKAVSLPVIEKDFPVEENLTKDMSGFSFRLGKEETEQLLTGVNQAFGTEINDILLTALGLGVRETFGHRHLLIAQEGHGREDILIGAEIDISRTIGWFTTVYPVLTDFSYAGDIARQVKEVKEELRRVPHKGIGYGILKYLTPPEYKQEIDFQLNPQISFNYLGQFDAEVGEMSFQMARESPGKMDANPQRGYQLEVSGMISAKRLKMTVTYNKKQFKPGTIQSLTDHFKAGLQQVIGFCFLREARQLTPSDLTYNKLSIETLDRLQRQLEIEDVYPLTPMQEGMLFHSLLEGQRSIYMEQASYRLHGTFDVSLIRKSLNRLFQRYDILRTAFIHEDLDRPMQVVLPNREVTFYYEDISRQSPEERETFVREYKKKDIRHRFHLVKDSLMRVAVIQLDESQYEFTWTHHHILIDGWCLGILIADFFEIYNGYLEKREPRLLPVTPYKRYIRWIEDLDTEENKNYWKKYLEDYDEASHIGTMKSPSTHSDGYQKMEVIYSIPVETAANLNQLAGRNRVTLNILCQVAWGILLGIYTGKEDVLFGAVVSGRPSQIEGVETMVGLFINTIPVRICFKEQTTVKELLQNVHQEAVNSETYHHYPLADIQAESVLKQNLLDHLFIFENFPIAEKLDGLVNPGKSGKERTQEGKSLQVGVSNFEMVEQNEYDFSVL
ncbi:MAG: AMP-binding protein, partial [bacterium]|nr:AMP-binding protein [bacterium]